MFHRRRDPLEVAKGIVRTWNAFSKQEDRLMYLIANALESRDRRITLLQTHGVNALVELSDALSFLHQGDVEEATARIKRAMRSLDILSAA